MLRIGAHMSVAGGLPRAVERAVVHGCEALQIFTKNANQWRRRRCRPDEIREFRDRVAATGIAPVVSHAQLPDQPRDHRRRRSASSRSTRSGDELDRAEALGLLGVVLHPGSYTSAAKRTACA